MSAANALSSGTISSDARPAEPSMEDILASIRRIIADDQSRHAQPPSNLSPSAPPPPSRTTPAPSAPAAASSAPVQGRRELPLSRPILPPQRPLSRPAVEHRAPGVDLAGLTPHLNPPPQMPMAGDHPVIDEIASAGVAAALRAGSAPEPAIPAVAEAPPIPAEDDAPDVAVAAETRAARMPPAATGSIEVMEPELATAPAFQEAHLAESVAFFSPDPAPEPLVSAAARATIETSFHALSASVFMQNAGMVEGLARDMLRPMLKSWLDDNLPGIVERLVRQEIERVARGGRT